MLNTINERTNCCEDLKRLRRNFNALLISSGNTNQQLSKLKKMKTVSESENAELTKLFEMGYNTRNSRKILKILNKTNLPRNKASINKYFTKKGTLRKEYKLVNI